MDDIARTDLGEMTAAELSALFRSGAASPVEAAQSALDRIERFNPATNAFAHVVPEMALEAARASETRWRRGEPLSPIDGAPTTMKELGPVAGIPLRRGSVLGSAAPSDVDSLMAARLRAAGAVFLGTTASPEFGWKGVTHSPCYGATLNPWNTSRASGGSSGGAAVAAALNMGVLHDGSDGAGSIRIPASFCGVFGIKQSFGWTPLDAPVSLQELAHRGPLTRTVEDSALFLNAVAGPTPHARYGYCPPVVPDFTAGLTEGVKGLRIGFARTIDGAPVAPGVAAAVERAAARLVDLGAVVEEDDPGFASPQKALLDIWYAGMALSLELAAPTAAQRERMDPGLLAIAERGGRLSAMDYIAADHVCGDLKVAMALYLERHDILMLPTMPVTAIPAGVDYPPDSGMTEWTDWSPFTYPFNMTGQPAVSVNCGFDEGGMPVGLQFVGPHFRDDLVLRAAAAYQSAWPEPFPEAPRAG